MDNKLIESRYVFLDGDVNPTVKKKDGNGSFTKELYEKDDVVSALEYAAKNRQFTSVMKLENAKGSFYIFQNKVQKIILEIPTTYLRNSSKERQLTQNEVNNYIENGSLSIPNIDISDKYVARLDNLIEVNSIRVKKESKARIRECLTCGAVLVGIAAAGIIFKDDNKSNSFQQNKTYNDTANKVQYNNGALSNQYSYLEKTVDDAIEASNIGGRKL